MPQESRQERTARLFSQDDTLQIICDHLANGGDLLDLSKTWDIRYSDLIRWLNSDDNRKRQWLSAMDARNEWAVQRLMSELRSLAFVDIRSIFDENHALLPPHKWSDEIARCVSFVEVNELNDYEDGFKIKIGEVKKIKLYDKLKAIEMLGKDLGRFVSKHEVSGKLTLEDLVTGSNKEE